MSYRWCPMCTHISDSRLHQTFIHVNLNLYLYFSQYDVTDLSREICRLEDENRQLTKQLESIVNTYQCCRQLFAVCVESFREVEANNGGTLSPTATLSPTLRDRSFSFKNTTSV